ncbi:hypothetical protein J6590_028163 [Homalodisca vitripennis]|nr:hypothetical protein J6590_028163 [Homalodisca vitripennis]
MLLGKGRQGYAPGAINSRYGPGYTVVPKVTYTSNLSVADYISKNLKTILDIIPILFRLHHSQPGCRRLGTRQWRCSLRRVISSRWLLEDEHVGHVNSRTKRARSARSHSWAAPKG